MARASQAQAEENRRGIMETASRLFRDQGTRVSVADLMKASGLTHGGFCKQIEHRDIAATGCPAAAPAIDMAREPGNREARRVYTEGVSGLAEWLATEGQDDMARLCTTLGALVLARATKGSPLSEETLTTARSAVTATSRDAPHRHHGTRFLPGMKPLPPASTAEVSSRGVPFKPAGAGRLRLLRLTAPPAVVLDEEGQQVRHGRAVVRRVPQERARLNTVRIGTPLPGVGEIPVLFRSEMIFWTARSVSLQCAAMSRMRTVRSSAITDSTRAWLVRNVQPVCVSGTSPMPPG